LRRENSALKTAVGTAGTEMTTGVVADILVTTGGNLQEILAIDHRIELTETYNNAIRVSLARAEIVQLSFETIGDLAGGLAPDLLATAGRGDSSTRTVLAADAKTAFESVVVVLNNRAAGVNLFGGEAVDGAVVDSATAILGDVGAIVAAQPDAASAAAAVDFYFNDPAGGFQTTRYLGSQLPGPQHRVGEHELAAPLPSALEPGVLAVLEGLALAASVAGGAFSGSPTDQMGLMDAAGRSLLAASDQVQVMRNDIGRSERRLVELQQSATAQSTALEMARADIVGVDQFDAASRFEALRGQLEISYLATARISQLTLASFLR